jgi:hypothetical protein
MSKWKISLYLAVLFLAGVVTGGILTAQAGKRMMLKAMKPQAMADHWRHDLEGRLNLTAEQSQKIEPMLMDGMSNFGMALCDQAELQLSNCNARIVVELTPQQKIKFTEIDKEQQQFIRSRFTHLIPPKQP